MEKRRKARPVEMGSDEKSTANAKMARRIRGIASHPRAYYAAAIAAMAVISVLLARLFYAVYP